MKKELLLEILSEEIPHAAILQLSEQLKKNAISFFEKNQINFEDIISFETPCRLAILVKNIEDKIPQKKIIKRGPPIEAAIRENQWTKQAIGFINSCTLNGENLDAKKIATKSENLINDLKKEKENGLCMKSFVSGKNNEKKDFLIFQSTIAEQKTIEVLPTVLKEILSAFDIAKQMTWGQGEHFFIRPVHKIIALFEEEIIHFDHFGVSSGKITWGHSSLENKEILINNPNEYEEKLAENFVFADGKKRKIQTERQIEELEKKHGFQVDYKKKLCQINHLLVEHPQLILCDFPEEFLEVPKEILIAEMVEHQKYFPILEKDNLEKDNLEKNNLNKDKKLLPKFIITSNSISKEKQTLQNIQNGNLRVIKARFSDGLFFYQKDLAMGIEKMRESAKQTIYQKDLGNYEDKTERMVAIAEYLTENFTKEFFPEEFNYNIDFKKIIPLLKADLFSNVVFEFPELQGVMGKYYAENVGYSEEIYLAIEQHYFPKGETTAIPENDLACFLAIVDKLDNLLGLFSVGIFPTGSSDVYALRRDAQGILRILIEKKIDLNLEEIIFSLANKIYFKIFENYCQQKVKKKGEENFNLENKFSKIQNKILSFLEERFRKVAVKDEEIGFAANDLIEKFFSQKKSFHPFKAMEQMRAFQIVRNYEEGKNSLNFLSKNPNYEGKLKKITEQKKRINKILSKFEKENFQFEILEKNLQQEEEKKLLNAIQREYSQHEKNNFFKYITYNYFPLISHQSNANMFKKTAQKYLIEITQEEITYLKELINTYKRLFDLSPLIDNFFKNVFIEVEDEALKNTRLTLLQKVKDIFDEVLL